MNVQNLKYALLDIESIEDSFYLQKKTLEVLKKQLLEKYKVAINIDKNFNEIINAKNSKQKKELINEFYDKKIDSKFTYKDWIEITDIDEEKGVLHYLSNPTALYINPMEAREELAKNEKQTIFNLEMVVTRIISLFEKFICYTAEELIRSKPENILCNKQIDYSVMQELEFKQEKILNFFINEELNGLTRESIKSFDYFTKNWGCNFDRTKSIIEDFKEIYYRRNMFIHNTRHISEDYIKKVNEKIREKWCKNNKFIFTQDYITFSFNTLRKLLISIYIETMFMSNIHTDNDVYELENLIFNKIYQKENWEVAKCTYSTMLKISNVEHVNKLMYQINLLYCLKKLNNVNDQKEFDEKIKLLDVSSCADMYKMAKFLLQDNYKEVNNILKSIYLTGKARDNMIRAQDILLWPIFKDYKKSPEYYEFIKGKEQDFKVVEFLQNEDQIESKPDIAKKQACA